MSTGTPDQTPPIIDERYEIVRHIGDGTTASVYEVIDRESGQSFALKISRDNTDSSAMKREAELYRSLRHPGIVAVRKVTEIDRRVGIIMELVEGFTLRELLDIEGALPMELALEIARQIALALDYAHGQGVIHRDIKPENVMITPNNEVKVMDFGIAVRDDLLSSALSDSISGTVVYISPEQALGDVVDGRSDLYSLGVMLYEMLTGEPPFTDENALTLIYRHLDEEPAPIRKLNPAVPEPISDLVHSLLAKSPDERVESAGELVRRIDDLLARIADGSLAVESLVMRGQPQYFELMSPEERGRFSGMSAESILTEMIALADGEMDSGAFEESLRHYDIAHQILLGSEVTDPVRSMHVLENSAWIMLHITGDLNQALERYHIALGICREYGLTDRMAEILKQIGSIHSIRGEFDISDEAYEESLQLFRDAGNLYEIANILNNLAINSFERGDHRRTMNMCLDVIEIAEENGYVDLLADANQLIGAVFSERELWKGAIKHYEESIKWFEQLNDLRRIAHVNLNLAIAHAGAGNVESALKILESCENAARELGESRLVAFALMNRAEVLARSDPRTAKPLCDEALQTIRSADDKPGTAEIYRIYGIVYTEMGEFDTARQFLETSLELYLENENIPGISRVSSLLAALCRRMGDERAAEEYDRKSKPS